MDTLHKILDLIWKKGISEIDFCNAIGINKSAVTDWKRGKTASYKKYLPQIARYFGVSAEYLSDNDKQAVPEAYAGFPELEGRIIAADVGGKATRTEEAIAAADEERAALIREISRMELSLKDLQQIRKIIQTFK